MKETRVIANTSVSGNRDVRNIILLMRSCYYSLTGEWSWDLSTDNLFCSDVILSIGPELTAPRAIIHPDSVKDLEEILLANTSDNVELEFQIITTYGEVKTLYGTDISISTETVSADAVEELVNKRIIEEKELHELRLLKEVYTGAERLTDSGSWFYNAVTHECWYSDQVFRIHGLPPQSLNSHLHTFLHFIHAEEKDRTKEFIDKAYKKRLPLHLDFQIVTSRGNRKVRYISGWSFNEKGEEILNGVYQDITVQKDLEENQQNLEQLSIFHKQVIALDEQHGGLAHWQLNLLTRKFNFSDNFYRLMGVKSQQITGINSLSNFIHPDDQEDFMLSVKKLFNEHLPPDIEYRIIRPDGNVRHFHQRARLITLENEMVMTVTVQDITVRKLLERKIAESTEVIAVKDSVHQRSEQLISGGNWILNFTTGNIIWSEGIYHLFGMKPHSADLTQKRLLLLVHGDDKKKFSDEWAMVVREKQDSEFNFKSIIRGETRYMKASFSIIKIRESEYFYGQIVDFTKENELQRALFRQVQVSELLAENILYRIIITDINNNIQLWNKRSEIEYGIKQDAAVGKNFFDLFPEMKKEQDVTLFARVLKGETVHLTDQKSSKGKGYFNIHMIPLWSESGTEVTGIIHIIQDITREYELRKNLSERLSFTESLIDSSIDRIIVLDKHMNYIAWNKRCEEVYGLTKDQVIGKNVLEVFPGWQDEAAYNHFRKALKGETVHLVPGEGEIRDYEVFLIPVKNAADEITAVLWVMHDFQLELQLEQQKRKNQVVLNALDENYFELDRSYRLVFLNKSAEKFFGLTCEEACGKVIWELMPSSGNEKLKEAVTHAMEEGIPVRNEFLSPNRKVPVFVSITPNEDGLSILFIDITEEKQNQIKLKEREDLIQQVTYATPDSITIYDLENKQPLYLNNNLASWLGYTNDELLKMGHDGRIRLFAPEDISRMIEFNSLMNHAEDEEIVTIDYTLFARSGEKVRIHNRSKVFRRNEKGKAVKMLSVLQKIRG